MLNYDAQEPTFTAGIHLAIGQPTVAGYNSDDNPTHRWIRLGDTSNAIAIHYDTPEQLDDLLAAIRHAATAVEIRITWKEQ